MDTSQPPRHRPIEIDSSDSSSVDQSVPAERPGSSLTDKLVILIVFALALTAAVVLPFLANNDHPSPTGAPLHPSSAGEFRGFALQLHYCDPNHPYEQLIDEIADTGANALQLVPIAQQEHASSSAIFMDIRRTPSRTHVVRLIRHAKRRGLRVVLMPIVLLENPLPGQWRGMIEPADRALWWEDYAELILHFASIAEEGNVDVFMVGSELVRTESQEQQWRHLVSRVREAFSGRIGYSANWDHYVNIAWWDAVDIVGMTTYHDLTRDGLRKPTLTNMLDEWQRIRRRILDWQKTVNRPILFTEVGWPNQSTAARKPWNYRAAPREPAPDLQANCFEAFFRTWFGQESVAGYVVWEWRSDAGDWPDETDTGYVPAGKPAMDVIRRWFHRQPPRAESPSSGRIEQVEQGAS